MPNNKNKSLKDPAALKEKGIQAFTAKNYQKALEFFSKAIEFDPTNPAHYSNRAAACIELEDYGMAIKDADKSIALDPNFFKGYIRKAQALREQGEIDYSYDILTQAIKLFSTNEDVATALARIKPEYDELHKFPADHPEIKKFDLFFKWLLESGSKFDKLQLRFYSLNYRGIHVKTKVKKGDIILHIQRSRIITLEMAKASPIGKKMELAKLTLISPKHSFLSTFIMQEKRKPDSEWMPYINILPQDLSCFPIFFTDSEKEWLKGSPFLNQIEEKRADIATDYKNICTAVPEYADFPLLEYSQIRMLVCSRIFGMNIDNIKTDGFVPMADMLNHRRPKQTSWAYSDAHKGFIIESLENIPRGECAFDSYGKKCNSRFFLNYGFIVENNDADEVPINVELNPDDPQYSMKRNLFDSIKPSKSFRVLADFSEKNTQHFLSFLRFVEYDGNPAQLYIVYPL